MPTNPVKRRRMTWLRSNLLGRIGGGARDLLFPPRCVACSEELEEQDNGCGFCSACRSRLPLVNWPTCRRCAARVPEMPGDLETCVRCETANHAFDQALALGSYDGLLRDLILRMKTDRSELLASVLGRLILDRLGASMESLSLDAIIPVPMPTTRRLVRGTNPPAAIAEVLSRSLNSPAYLRLLTKSHNASPQRGLSKAGRFRNVRGQIGIRPGYHLLAPHVLLVDDTMTTGATCGEAARVLKRQGADRVTVLVVGRTPNT
jgi:ComF family protein